MSQKSVKGKPIDDHLASHPLPDIDPVQAEFPDEMVFITKNLEKQKTWILYFNGALNTKGKGVRVILTSLEGVIIPSAYQLAFPCSHNIAKYEALINGLRMAILLNVKYPRIIGDSK